MSMLFQVLTLGLTAHGVFGAELNTNSENSNYMIVNFNQNEFPMAIGRCVPFNVLGQGGYQKATCNDAGTGLTYETFGDATCGTTPTTTTEFNSSTQTGSGTYFDFKCDGVDVYASIEFAVGTCDTNTKVTMDAAVSACALLTGLGTDDAQDFTSINVYCETNYAELQYFDSPGSSAATCTHDAWYQTANATDECGFILKTGDDKIFGEILDCTVGVTTDDDDSANLLNIFNPATAIVITTIVAIYKIF